MRNVDGQWIEVDLFYEAGIAYMREHVDAGGDPNVGEEHIHGKGFPLGRWVGEMHRRDSAGELSSEQREADRRAPRLALGLTHSSPRRSSIGSTDASRPVIAAQRGKRVDDRTAREQVVAQALPRRARETALLVEPRERGRLEHRRPQVRVVGALVVAGEDVDVEARWPRTVRDRGDLRAMLGHGRLELGPERDVEAPAL